MTLPIENITKPQTRQSALTPGLSASLESESFASLFESAVQTTKEGLTHKDTEVKKKDDTLEVPPFISMLAPLVAADAPKLGTSNDLLDIHKKAESLSSDQVQGADQAIDNNSSSLQQNSLAQVVVPQLLERLQGQLASSGISIDAVSETKAVPDRYIPKVSYTELVQAMAKEIAKKQNGAFRIALEPDSLGKIDVYVSLEKGKLHIAIAAQEDVRKMMLLQKDQLQDALQSNPAFAKTTLEFADFDSPQHRQFEQGNSSQDDAEKEYAMLNIIGNQDILKMNLNSLVSDMIINYIA